MSTPRLELLTDPVAFLDVAGDHLADDPVLSTVVATVARRTADAAAQGVDPPAGLPHWYAVVRDDSGAVVGAAMRTAPFVPYPMYVLPMPEAAALLLARTLHDRGEEVRGVNGSLPAARTVAEETARLTGGTVVVSMHTRLFELKTLVPARPVTGRLRPVAEEEADLAHAWFVAFRRDADEQAGRPPGPEGHIESFTREDMVRRIRGGSTFFWDDGGPVHLTSANPPAFGVARIGPVYTPPDRRGRGYASAAVAEVSQRLLDEGSRVCLFTDQANPTSNRIYEALGYRPVVDMADHRVVPAPVRGLPTP